MGRFNGKGKGSEDIPTQVTIAQALALGAAETVVVGQLYEITDPTWANWVKVRGISTIEFSINGIAEFWLPDQYAATTDQGDGLTETYDNVWFNDTDGGSYAANATVAWDNLVYKNLTGTNTDTNPTSDTTNWLVNPQSVANGYVKAIYPVQYSADLDDAFGVGILKVTEEVQQNEVYMDITWVTLNGFQNNVERFQWGTGLFANENCHAHVGTIDNRNSRRIQKYIYCQGHGEVTLTRMALGQSTWVQNGIVTISGTGATGFTECYLSGTASRLTSTVDGVLSAYVYATAQAKITASGTANITGLNVEGDITVNVTGTGKLQRIKIDALDSGKTITAGNLTNIDGGWIHTAETMDLTGKVLLDGCYVTPERSNLPATITIATAAIDFDVAANRMCGEITLIGEGSVADTLSTISNSGKAPKYFVLLTGSEDITLDNAGNIVFESGVSGTVMASGKNDLAELFSTGSLGGVAPTVMKIYNFV